MSLKFENYPGENMNSVIIHKCARSVGIINPSICIIRNVAVYDSDSTLDARIAALINTISSNPDSILDRPEVRGFEELFFKLGYGGQLHAGKRLVEGFKARGFKKFNNLVDAYNIASAQACSGIGMHDAKSFLESGNALEILRCNGTEKIRPLFKDKWVSPKPQDLIYGFGTSERKLMAWLGKKDVDSDEFKVNESTTDILLVALGNSRTQHQYNKSILTDAFNLIKLTCPKAEMEFLRIIQEGISG